MMRTLDDIIGLIEEYKEEIKKKFRVKEIGVFGSYVRGRNERNKRCRCFSRIRGKCKSFSYRFLKA
ncbi:MAG: nucleotidyltransferase domain-containing protein [Archaeoglobaceae archaeon]